MSRYALQGYAPGCQILVKQGKIGIGIGVTGTERGHRVYAKAVSDKIGAGRDLVIHAVEETPGTGSLVSGRQLAAEGKKHPLVQYAGGLQLGIRSVGKQSANDGVLRQLSHLLKPRAVCINYPYLGGISRCGLGRGPELCTVYQGADNLDSPCARHKQGDSSCLRLRCLRLCRTRLLPSRKHGAA